MARTLPDDRTATAVLVLTAGLLITGGAEILLLVCARTRPAEGLLLTVWTMIFAMLALVVILAIMFARAPDRLPDRDGVDRGREEVGHWPVGVRAARATMKV